ncbi:MAG: glucose-6-phosphate dehydrogenase [Nitrospiria bacterium]
MKPGQSEEQGHIIVAPSLSGQETLEERPPEPSGLVIFGASGDLTQRKLIPALFHLSQNRFLPDHWYVVGVGRTEMDDDRFRKVVKESLKRFSKSGPVSASLSDTFGKRFHYFVAPDPECRDDYSRLGERLRELDKVHKTEGNHLFYLATPPSLYSIIIRQLGIAGLNRRSEGWTRVVVEKPFGTDLASAQVLSRQIREVFQEEQIYRIDHYLGKEAVQNMLFLRFANTIFEPIWNRRYIDHVQITAAEDLGVENRAGYYEGAGALRDMFQNHLLQLLCLVAMEPPASCEADRIRDEKVKVLRSVRPIRSSDIYRVTARGQYGTGRLADRPVQGYRGEPGVASDSTTETFAALKLRVDNWRWQGVPFYLRSGKRLPKKVTEIAIEFKRVPHLLFRPLISGKIHSNTLILSVQPSEGISLTFQAKYPGPKFSMGSVTMDFNYHGSFETDSPDAYERLLLDCLSGDQMLFSRRDWVELSWSLLMPLLDHWREAPPPNFPNYPAGSMGPKEADELIERDGRYWRSL